MNGLRVYTYAEDADARNGQAVFYSRRESGPYYRWRYEKKVGQWHGSRVHPSELTPKALCVASWRIVPTALQARLSEHYLE